MIGLTKYNKDDKFNEFDTDSMLYFSSNWSTGFMECEPVGRRQASAVNADL